MALFRSPLPPPARATIFFNTATSGWPRYILGSTLRTICHAIPGLEGYFLKYKIDALGYVVGIQFIMPTGEIPVGHTQSTASDLDCLIAFSATGYQTAFKTNQVDIATLKVVVASLPLAGGYRLAVAFNAQGGVVSMDLLAPGEAEKQQ